MWESIKEWFVSEESDNGGMTDEEFNEWLLIRIERDDFPTGIYRINGYQRPVFVEGTAETVEDGQRVVMFKPLGTEHWRVQNVQGFRKRADRLLTHYKKHTCF